MLESVTEGWFYNFSNVSKWLNLTGLKLLFVENVDGMSSIPRKEHSAVKPGGHTRPHKPKRNKAKERLSR